ncbi:hypothetical protein ASPWEDRAFT_39788 [Aspergillus wentii DTO 134E9]|uniref:Uncharacterized protein n=1 Tax=Aspergillus wentii DTO 134E9 TaxID=1073089 RepID=A0A1L9RIF5_ASPWE|nr:uncharacterized protein ASPWEDRAFT_39788 [Aspergillus wentii DTO 134E9]OJJ34712.1 hypothetical protein ASPWEDRAFT_39788 [Aspergillus wentii DTO 134E9]
MDKAAKRLEMREVVALHPEFFGGKGGCGCVEKGAFAGSARCGEYGAVRYVDKGSGPGPRAEDCDEVRRVKFLCCGCVVEFRKLVEDWDGNVNMVGADHERHQVRWVMNLIDGVEHVILTEEHLNVLLLNKTRFLINFNYSLFCEESSRLKTGQHWVEDKMDMSDG